MSTREELVKAVKDAEVAYVATWNAYLDAKIALKAYDKESNDSFHNFAECLCESYQREELVKAVYEARVSCDYSNRDAYAAHWKCYHEATAALKAYDKEKNT